ncbi:MAG: hypothetical protein KGN84_20295, partial [Acidobacteriota bacterium]|nr:hypothetical protein [Acidobacteriota bacterium]
MIRMLRSSDRIPGAIFFMLAALPIATAVTVPLSAATGAVTNSPGPSYSVDSIVHTATQTPEALAPNAIATIYGTYLSFGTASAGNLVSGQVLPDLLSGVTVVVGGLIA